MPRIDPIELELMRNLFEAAAEEMGYVLRRVAFSANIKERRDFSCALFDADGELLAQAAHIPVHLGSMPESVAAIRGRFGNLADGDVAIVNDPFAGGTHLPDITIVSPIYADDVLVGYAANRAHHADVGGVSPGSMTLSRHIDEEGIRIEPALLLRRGVRDDAVLNRLLDAVRTPAERLGDLDAQLAANVVGAGSLRKMVAAWGLRKVRECGRALLDYSAVFMSRTIATLPDGEYSFADVMDDDGADTRGIRVAVTIRIAGDKAELDFRDSSGRVPGCINAPEAVTRSAVYYCFVCLMQAGYPDVPMNGGCFRNIRIVTRPGSLLHAQYPAAVVAGNVETSQRVVDVVFGALAQAAPPLIPAASCGTMNSVAIGGVLADASRWTYYETIGGGSGASPAGRGASAVQCHMTNTLNTPAEAIELQYPLRVRAFQRATNTGGSGRHRGGDGIIRELEALADCEGTIIGDRRESVPYGLRGGQPGVAGVNSIRRADGTTNPLPAKSKVQLAAGDVLRIQTPGGGGWGNP